MEMTECGAASLAMILGFHGRHAPLEELREACGVSRNGSTAALILRAAETYQLTASGYKIPAQRLTELPLPSMLFWDFNHFVVFEGRSGGKYHINDPARGPVSLTEDEFVKHYTGVVLIFQPNERFVPQGRRRGVLSTLLPLLGKARQPVAAIAWAGLLLVAPGLLAPAMLRIFIDDVLAGKQEWLYPLLLAFALTALVQALLVWLSQMAMRRGELLLAARSTIEMLRHIFTLPMNFFTQRNSAVLQQQVAMNSTAADAVFNQLAGNAVNLLTAVFFLALMCAYSLFLSGVAVLTMALNVLLLRLINERRQTLQQALTMERTRQVALTITGISMMESLRAGGREDSFFNEWSSRLADYAMKRQAMQYSSTIFAIVPALLFGVSGVVILCFGAWRIIEGDMTLGTMMAFNSLLACFIAPVNSLVAAGAELQELKGAVERIDDVMRHAPEKRFAGESGESVRITAQAGPGPAAALTLELRELSFGYSRLGPPLIENFSLRLDPGKWVALVGISGSGKSTVARLASGLYPPWSGRILLGGRPLEEYSRADWNRHIAWVDQNVLLFSGTIADNLTLFQKNLDPVILHKALCDAAISEELARRGPYSELDIKVGERGNNFSGGQRQRIEIARALARSAPILILDEATSALDPITEAKIYQALRDSGSACLIAAHRLSAIRNCDEIIVMEGGKAVERGSHAELAARDGLYRRLMQTM